MDLLISKTDAARLGTRLEKFSRHHRLLELDQTGAVHLENRRCAPSEMRPEIAWLSFDIFALGLLDPFMEIVSANASLRWVHTVHAGIDLPCYSAILAKRIRLSNSHAHAPAVAEFVLCQVLGALQSTDRRRRLQAARQWHSFGFRELSECNWLIVGLGSIGNAIANRAKPFGAHITGVVRHERQHPSADTVITPERILDALPNTDVVVLSCPLTQITHNLVNMRFLDAMKTGSILVNVSRGALVDEEALIRGLETGKPGFAVLDVTVSEPLPSASPLWGHEQVCLTAHSAFWGSGTTRRGDDLFLENLRRFHTDGSLLNEVTDA